MSRELRGRTCVARAGKYNLFAHFNLNASATLFALSHTFLFAYDAKVLEMEPLDRELQETPVCKSGLLTLLIFPPTREKRERLR